MRNERPGEGRPASLMRGSETLSGLAVEVFIEEERISPCRIVLEAGVCAVRRPPAVCVEQKQTQETALKLRRNLV